ncbi:phospholipid/cholesterol/gamma-HCH transport system permease protein [Desulfatibacillum alkenivorans DSM 16219]|jgi:phospholipid/cholesterol/gamma-HCH transport system permease protein|uniref:Phospholipid/cholesterol/gamma-HCH transport system permease protein n=1 Tax=Desulfatibacillum alkenivorans DSM 16219 TaxID=1121393 RepID=A0A1M6GUF8_9BACT|nr:MlaE family lipid ABC transporter permease subunit [Desulfatibacillum alkenivorans]SHJ13544.1 phospholipid/cholesterol/gamma-HCH transport system permease protein [Desulfatibacillum alkenivorans DSM 16219]
MNTLAATFTIEDNDGKGSSLRLHGPLDQDAYFALAGPLRQAVKKGCAGELVIDLKDVTRLDDFGALLLAHVHKAADAVNCPCSIEAARPSVREVLDLLHFQRLINAPALEKPKHENPFVALGGAIIDKVLGAKELIDFTGDVLLCAAIVVRHPFSMRWDDMLTSMRKVGVDAVPIVGLINFLLGFIMAFMTSVQLKQFGANIYVAPLVAIAMVRELGPIMTAIVVTGRSGSAFASEIGAMKISEEVDALSTMGFNPVVFLVMPKMAAAMIVMPILTVFACLFGILGGLLVGVVFLDLTLSNYLSETIDSLSMYAVNWCFFKAVVFAFLITWIGCLRGFQVKGGSSAVGEATTSSVVSGIFLIILWDCIFAFIQLYWS